MMQGKSLVRTLVMVSLGILFLVGCVNLGKGTERLPRLYLLTPMASPAEGVSVAGKIEGTIGIGPLAMPEYLNRPQIVTRGAGHQLQAAPFANWAEPLKRNVMRVLADNITALAGNEAVYSYPWRVGYAPRYQLQVELVQFDADRNGAATLIVRWEWVDQVGAPMMSRRRSVLKAPLQGQSDDAVVDAMSRLLLEFSRTAIVVLEEKSR
jgi:uncharacterized lipoprotein YmbA